MNEKVLVVEDEASIRSFIVINLNISNFDVKEASSGEDALKTCENYTPEVAILDIMMPGIDGYKLCEILREKFPNIAIIMLTAKSQEREKIEEDSSNPEFIKTIWGYGYRFSKS